MHPPGGSNSIGNAAEPEKVFQAFGQRAQGRNLDCLEGFGGVLQPRCACSKSEQSMRNQKAKTVADSATETVELVLPNDANSLGSILGGKVMHLIDIAGAISARRHCRSVVVTASVDSLDFLHPIKVGQLIVLRAFVTRAFNTSLEVEVNVFLEDCLTGERRQTSSAFVTYVALDRDGRPTKVPPIVPVTAEEKRRFREALERRHRRLALAARAHRRYFEKEK